MRIGDRIRTTYQHSWTGVIVKARRGEATRPGWHIVKDDDGGGKLCVHESMMVVRNARTEGK